LGNKALSVNFLISGYLMLPHEPLHPGEIIKELCVDAAEPTVTEVAKS